MAMKKTRNTKPVSKKDDIIIYNIIIALCLVCLAVVALLQVNRLAIQIDTMVEIYDATIYVAIAAAVCTILSLIANLIFKAKAGKLISLIGMILFGTVAISAALLRVYWTTVIPLLFFVYIAAGVLFIIFEIYQHEFFLISCLTTLAGCCFYIFSKISPLSFKFYFLCLVFVIFVATCAFLTFTASKNGGKISLGKRQFQLFVPDFSPIFLYATCVIWALCLIAVACLGSTFAYYCMFAAMVYELIAACYYTIKLT